MTLPRFDHFLAIDWSGAKGERQKGIALAMTDAAGGAPRLLVGEKPWSRSEVLEFLRHDLPGRTLIGLDLGISLPFADDPRLAPFFRRHGGREGAQFRCDGAAHGRGRLRVTEHAQAAMGLRPYSNFNLVGAAQVGKSSLTGMRMLHQLEGAVPVWPIDPLPASGSVITEIYTALAAIQAGRAPGRTKIREFAELDDALSALGSATMGKKGPVDDHSSDALITAAWLRKSAGEGSLWSPPQLTAAIACTEGWTFGA